MKTVEVKATTKSYTVHIAPGLIAGAGEHLRKIIPEAQTLAIVTDDTVDALHAPALEKSLADAGYNTFKFVLPHGEQSKTGENYLAILSFLAEHGLTRTDALLALGGGMVGDIAAFSAATYLRGIKYVQLPTTLLAMVDSSVGGKTAIDLPAGKNLAGAFCQPETVLCDTDTLSTLPDDILRDGCAEVLKYAVLGDSELFEMLLEKGTAFPREEVIARCVAMKRDYVEADEFDTGLRRKLNLGHTLGHGVEKLSDFELSHGQSVAIGLAAVCRASGLMEVLPALEKLGLPAACPYGIEALLPLMLSDKKRAGALINVIVPCSVGDCHIVPMDESTLKAFMKAGI